MIFLQIQKEMVIISIVFVLSRCIVKLDSNMSVAYFILLLIKIFFTVIY